MQLLTFAHKNEASSFLHYHEFQESAHVKNLYSDGKNFLLVTGEGLWDSLTSTMKALGYLQSQNKGCSEVYNLGVAGALRPSIKKHSLFSIRTSYAYSSNENPEFQSYTNSTKNDSFLQVADCVSSYKRNTSVEEKNHIAPFAPLVDRELWSIAKAATTYNLPWQSIKIVSDELVEENTCQIIQNLSQEFSSRLYIAWKESSLPVAKENLELINKTDHLQHLLKTLQDSSLYLTFSQKHQVIDLVTRILRQEHTTLSDLLSEVPFERWHELRPKDKSQHFVHWLRLRLTPQLGRHATKVQDWLIKAQGKNKNLHINAVEDFEALEIKFKSYNKQDWEEVLSLLNSLSRNDFDQILRE